ncbi:hypothetical protein [Bradyrhizobium japonicum]|uniref:hypothetical protein n=1 Tax=Bradyrhizobium japonicum TaxID=375 RepID=UPI0012DB1650|nr:hypothetical protein [Bradyrhizobium japonicum]
MARALRRSAPKPIHHVARALRLTLIVDPRQRSHFNKLIRGSIVAANINSRTVAGISLNEVKIRETKLDRHPNAF